MPNMFSTDSCPVKCKSCLTGKNHLIEQKDICFIFDDFSDYQYLHTLFENIDDLVSKEDVQCLYLSYLKNELSSTFSNLYDKCGEQNLINHINCCNPKAIYCFGIKSFHFLNNSKINYNTKIGILLNNARVKNIYLFAAPNLKIMFEDYGTKTTKYNPMLLEFRLNFQLYNSIIQKINIKNNKLQEL